MQPKKKKQHTVANTDFSKIVCGKDMFFRKDNTIKELNSQQMPVKDVTSVSCRQVLPINYIFYILLYWLSNLILLFISYKTKTN